MAKKNKKEIEIGINAPFDLGHFNQNIDEQILKNLKKINISKLTKTDILNKDKFNVLIIDSFFHKNFQHDNYKEEIIYNIINDCGTFKVFTGKFIGNLIVNGIKIVINSGYGEFFEKRLLDYSNEIYLDNSAKYKNTNDKDYLFSLLQYLFLVNLKKASIMGLPKEYKLIHESNYHPKGNIDYVKYLFKTNNLNGIPYSYKKREYSKEIISVIDKALSLTNDYKLLNTFKEIGLLREEIRQNTPYKSITQSIIEKAKNARCLNTGTYFLYKKVLTYAEMIIMHNGFSPTADNEKSQVVGWLIDIADLWEVYLYKLLVHNFPDWTIFYQEEIPIYKKLFFGTRFMPDIVMKKANKVVIIDAKFKKMDFNDNEHDVDREDLQQIHTYYAYYDSLGNEVIYTTLVYPAREEPPQGVVLVDSIFNSDKTSRFGISYLKVAETNNEQINNEKDFINRLRNIINF